MSARLLTDELWNEIHSFFPVYRPAPQGGRPPIANRVVLTAILFVLKSGIAWEDLPLEIGCSYKTCYRRLQGFPTIGGQPGRPLEQPRSVTADKGYDCQASRDLLAACGIATHIPRRGEEVGPPLGRLRWPIERTLS